MDRMRLRHGGDDGIALYYQQQGVRASCFLYKWDYHSSKSVWHAGKKDLLIHLFAFSLLFANIRPPEMDNQIVNKTVRTCCEGWVGPRCSEGEFCPGFLLLVSFVLFV